MEFFNQSKTPPAIHTLPKNYLDLLGKPRRDARIGRTALLYDDDRQVKALIVRYHLEPVFGTPQIWIRAEPFCHFLDDLELVDFAKASHFGDEAHEGPFPSFDYDFHGKYEQLLEWVQNKDSYLRFLSEKAYESSLTMSRLDVQQQWLKHTDKVICSWLLDELARSPIPAGTRAGDMLAAIKNTTRNMLMTNAFTIELHHAPHRTGDNAKFKETLKKQLESFKDQRSVLFPLVSLLNVTVLMVPPAGGGKDLDNLAKLIVPAIHEIWAPPSHLTHALCPKETADNPLDDYWKAQKESLPKEPRYSITEYRVFELPRRTGDPQDGFVRLSVGEGFSPLRFRESIDDYLNEWAKSFS